MDSNPTVTAEEVRTPREPVRPPEAAEMNGAIPAGATAEAPAPVPAPNVFVSADDFQRAETQLALFLRQHLDPSLIKGVSLTLAATPKKGKVDIKLILHDGTTAANGLLLGTKVVEALRQHPVIGGMFDREEPPHVQHPDGTPNDAVEIHIPQFELAEYASVVHGIANPGASVVYKLKSEAPAVAAAPKTHADTCAGCDQCSKPTLVVNNASRENADLAAGRGL